MDYQVYSPSRELLPFLKCFWTLEEEAMDDPVPQRVVPDGCMEMVFHYGDPYRQIFEDGSSIVQPRSFVFGQITRYIEIVATGRSGIVSARFLPDGFASFLSIGMSSLEDRAVGLEELFGEVGLKLESEVLNASDNKERIRLIEGFLISRLSDPATINRITKDCVDAIFRSQGQVGIGELAEKLNINRRKMERKFTSMIGISPKQLSRVIRMQATLKMLEQKKFTSLTSLAYENGYYDQAHFVKDFKEFTGQSPKLFFADNLRMATLFVGEEGGKE